jgi:lambda repressor-like predicted transcriptional regulator
MEPADIQCVLKKKGITQKAIARKLGVKEMSVSKVINRQIVADRIMRAVAEEIGLDRLQVFPEYYGNPPKRKTSKVSRT